MVGRCVSLWRQARKTGQLPPPRALRQARRVVGWRKLQLDRKPRTARLRAPRMRLDLGGVAKGYAANQAQAALRKRGITADSLSTAICVLGAKRGAELARAVKGTRAIIRRAEKARE
jgi:FAD:protein FMN transferase